MPETRDTVRVRVKSGESEAEIEAPLSSIRDAIELIPAVLERLPKGAPGEYPRLPGARPEAPRSGAVAELATAHQVRPQAGAPIPMVTVEKGDSLSDVISKFFGDPWGRSPRKLLEVREALQSYGLSYPKQSVAVALLRLAKASRLRRFKGEGGEFVYTVSTGAIRIAAPLQPAPIQPSAGEEPAPPAAEAEEQAPAAEAEEQLNLDAPAAN